MAFTFARLQSFIFFFAGLLQNPFVLNSNLQRTDISPTHFCGCQTIPDRPGTLKLCDSQGSDVPIQHLIQGEGG